MKKLLIILVLIISLTGCNSRKPDIKEESWGIAVLPSSVRLDPVTNEIIDKRFVLNESNNRLTPDMLSNNLVYNGKEVNLHGARGEYISFQLVLTNNSCETLDNIRIEMQPFGNGDNKIETAPELFLEWAVEVKTPSTGYQKASLGRGWYPDALIPFRFIQYDSSVVRGRWTYPLWLPDFNNRIDGQKSMIIWVDQYIPFDRDKAEPGKYSSLISVRIKDELKSIPVNLAIWDFAVPNENRFRAGLQHEGFMKSMQEDQELEIYQLLKRNRVAMLDPTYEPVLKTEGGGRVILGWKDFDARLDKYFTGRAFTADYGYNYGPGYGEPLETFVLPFDVYGKHGTKGWPDTGKPGEETSPSNRAVYTECIKQVRGHLKTLIDPAKTDLTVYLNGLDESYFPEAWNRMVYYGNMFREYYPEAYFRIDGGYSEEAMAIVKNSISSWASHTIEYDYATAKKYQDMGIRIWLYGPMLYESKVNSWVGSSTFLDLPLVNDRAISWSCWKYKTYSWLSWGAGAGWINGWYDPESWKDASKARPESDAEFTFKKINGNALLIYAPGVVPNVDGACPSIRLKTMRDGIQEYEYLRMLSEADGNTTRSDSIVNLIIKQPFGPKSIGNLDVWSYDNEKWDEQRIAMGKMIEKSLGKK